MLNRLQMTWGEHHVENRFNNDVKHIRGLYEKRDKELTERN